MKLFNFLKSPKEPKTNSINQPLDHLIDGELPFGWIKYHQEYFKTKDDGMVELASKALHIKDKNERIIALQKLIDYFYSYKAECDAKGECFAKFFDMQWMHCKNSRCEDFIYITPYEEELLKLKQ